MACPAVEHAAEVVGPHTGPGGAASGEHGGLRRRPTPDGSPEHLDDGKRAVEFEHLAFSDRPVSGVDLDQLAVPDAVHAVTMMSGPATRVTVRWPTVKRSVDVSVVVTASPISSVSCWVRSGGGVVDVVGGPAAHPAELGQDARGGDVGDGDASLERGAHRCAGGVQDAEHGQQPWPVGRRRRGRRTRTAAAGPRAGPARCGGVIRCSAANASTPSSETTSCREPSSCRVAAAQRRSGDQSSADLPVEPLIQAVLREAPQPVHRREVALPRQCGVERPEAAREPQAVLGDGLGEVTAGR